LPDAGHSLGAAAAARSPWIGSNDGPRLQPETL